MLLPPAVKPPYRVPWDASIPIRASEVISSLSYALDLTEGQPAGHAVRTCVIALRIAEAAGLKQREQLRDLYFAALMKDAGCSTNAARMCQILGSDDIKAKREVKTTDWTRLGFESLAYALGNVRTGAPLLERMRWLVEVARHQDRNAKELVQIRCERGASIARRLGLSDLTAEAIHGLDEHWNGKGQPDGLRGEEIPLLARILNLAQNADVFYVSRGPEAAREMARQRSGRWFDPALVKAFLWASGKEQFWADVENASARVIELAPDGDQLPATEEALDNICLAFADVIDAKSPFTYRHSTGVAGAAVAIAQMLGLSHEEVVLLRRAALLHDIGKLGVSNMILDKPDKLTAAEWELVKQHPRYSLEILQRIPAFGQLSEIAASHHEKLDGSGYFRGYGAEQMSLPARILVVADIYDALAGKRPYRCALEPEQVFDIMRHEVPNKLDATCFEALQLSTASAGRVAADLLALSRVALEDQAAVGAAKTEGVG